MKTLFIDESGKTGTQRFDGKWNFANQPYFLLCGILIDNEKIEMLNNAVLQICSKYKIQGNELKSTRRAVKKNINEIIEDILRIQQELNYNLFIEMVDKKFCIAMIITDYCVFPYYDISAEYYYSEEANILRRYFANYIYKNVSDSLLGEYAELFDSGRQDISELENLCRKLIKECNNCDLTDYIEETIDSFTRYKELHLLKRHVFPLVDYYKGDISSVAVCPQIDCFNNLLTRANKIQPLNEIDIIHDKISDLDDALTKNVEKFFSDNLPHKMSFEDSKKVIGLQVADLFGGYIRYVIEEFLMQGQKIPSYAANILKFNTNFVGKFNEQTKLFPCNDEIKLWKLDYDCHFTSK